MYDAKENSDQINDNLDWSNDFEPEETAHYPIVNQSRLHSCLPGYSEPGISLYLTKFTNELLQETLDKIINNGATDHEVKQFKMKNCFYKRGIVKAS